jgi:hypothetical protein
MDEKHWRKAGTAYEPTMFSERSANFHGAKIGGGAPAKYVVNGNSPAYPPLSMSAALGVSSGGASLAGVDGAVGVGGKYSVKQFSKDFSKIGKLIKPVAQPLLKAATDKGVALIEGAGKTGGRKKKAYSVNQFAKDFSTVGKLIRPVAQPLLQAATKKGVALIEGAGKKKTNKRAEIVKKVMQEKGMKLIEASKYVKEHGLYKP